MAELSLIVIAILVIAPKVLICVDLYDHTETPITHVPIGTEEIVF